MSENVKEENLSSPSDTSTIKQPDIQQEAEKARDACPCSFTLINCTDLANLSSTDLSCMQCGDPIPLLHTFNEQLNNMKESLNKTKKLFSAHQNEAIKQIETLGDQIRQKDRELDQKNLELASINKDLRVMGDKLVDEIEKRAELQHSNETIQEELSELTQSLFEQANSMVSTANKDSYNSQTREKALEEELQELKHQHELNVSQLFELKDKMSRIKMIEDTNSDSNDLNDNYHHRLAGVSTYIPLSTTTTVEQFHIPGNSSRSATEIDPTALSLFKEFYNILPSILPGKISSLPYIKFTIEEDIEPCLKFRHCSRFFLRRIFDCVANQTCFIEKAVVRSGATPSTSPVKQQQSTGFDIKEPQGAVTVAKNSVVKQITRVDTRSSVNSEASNVEEPVKPSTPPPTLEKQSSNFMNRLSSFMSNSNSSSPHNEENSTDSSIFSGSDTCYTCSHPINKNQGNVYILKLNTNDSSTPSYNICTQCRNRLTAACGFYSIVANLQKGLYSGRKIEDIFKEFVGVKEKMFWARVGSSQKNVSVRVSSSIPRPNSAPLFNSTDIHELEERISEVQQQQQPQIPLAMYPVEERVSLDGQEVMSGGFDIPPEIEENEWSHSVSPNFLAHDKESVKKGEEDEESGDMGVRG